MLLLCKARDWKTEYMATQGQGTGWSGYGWIYWLFDIMEDPRNVDNQRHNLKKREKEIFSAWEKERKTFRYDVKEPKKEKAKRAPKPNRARIVLVLRRYLPKLRPPIKPMCDVNMISMKRDSLT